APRAKRAGGGTGRGLRRWKAADLLSLRGRSRRPPGDRPRGQARGTTVGGRRPRARAGAADGAWHGAVRAAAVSGGAPHAPATDGGARPRHRTPRGGGGPA